MQSLIFKSLLSVGMIVLFASNCNPTIDPIAGQALFKKLAFTVDKVNYDFDFEAEPTPGTLAINNSTPTNLANAQQTASGATLVVDGKTYGIAYKNIDDTVYLTLTLPEDVESLPTSITFNTLSVSEKSTLVDQNGASITEGQSLSRRNDAFIAKIISKDGKKNTIYNIQLKKAIATGIPTITKLVIAVDASQTAQAIEVNLETLTALFPAGSDIPSEIVIKEIATSPQDLKVVKTGSQDALSANSKVALEDDKLLLSVTSQSDQSKSYEIAVIKEARSGSVLSSITLDYLNDDNPEVAINLTGVSTTITLEMGVGLKSDVMIDGYQLADDSKGATVSLSGGSTLSSSTPTEVTLENNAFKLYVTPVGGGEATEYTITFREALHTGSTLMSLTLTGTDIEEVITFTATQTQAMISLASTVPDQVTVSDLLVSEEATVTVGGEMIQTDQEKEITFNGSPIIFTVTSQSGISTDYTIVFDLQNILNSLVLDVAGEAVELQVSTGNTHEWIGEIGFDNALTGSGMVKVTSLSLSDNNRARIIPKTGETVEVEKDKTFSLNEYNAMLEVYVEGDEDDKQVYTLRLQKNSIMMKSYSQETLGTEVPPLGIALLDTLKDPNNPTEGFDYPALTISGLQKKATNYRLSIEDKIFDKEIKSTADGELILMKRDFMPFMPATDILTKTVTADIKLLPAGAEGTEIAIIGKYDKSKIRNWKDLQGMRMDLAASYTLENDIVLPTPGEEGLPQKGFEPIGTLILNDNGSINNAKSTPFAGKLNVVDKEVEPNKITGLSIDRSSEDYVGLFSYVKDAEIRNLMIESRTVIGNEYIGALAGVAGGNTKIENVGVTGGDVNGNSDVGGLVGNNHGTITSCYATGDVTGSNSNVGGLVGFNSGSGTITSCYATGNVEGSEYVGGLVGFNSGSGTITSCYATGAVESDSGNVGGLVGSNSGTITSCYATGAVESDYGNVGGLVGSNYNAITSCYATGAVTGKDEIGREVGGLVGSNSGTITSCYYDKETTGQTDMGKGDGIANATAITQESDLGGFEFGQEKAWKFEEGEWPTLQWETNQGL